MGLSLQRITQLVQEVLPDMEPEEIRLMAIEASDAFCEETEIIQREFPPITTIADQMFYDIDDRCLEINQVDIAGEVVKRLPDEENIKIQD